LERNDVEETLQTVDRLWYSDRRGTAGNAVVVLVAEDNGASLASSDLRKGRLHFWIERILSHDDDDRHVLVNQGERAVLELAGQDTLRVKVADFFDFQRTLKASSVSDSQT